MISSKQYVFHVDYCCRLQILADVPTLTLDCKQFVVVVGAYFALAHIRFFDVDKEISDDAVETLF